MVKTYGVKINDKHSFNDLGLVMMSKDISSPVPKSNLVEVPGRDGSIDISEVLTGNVVYEDREMTLTFYSQTKVKNWSAEISLINSYFAGKQCRFVFDDDASFVWKGRVTSIQPKYNGRNETIELKAIIEPYKYDVVSSAYDWEWDPFDFEESIINEFGQVVVDGTTEVVLICRGKRMWPIFTASEAMTVEYDGETHNLKAGEQKVYGMFLTEGENKLIFRGNGTVSIDYVGGVL